MAAHLCVPSLPFSSKHTVLISLIVLFCVFVGRVSSSQYDDYGSGYGKNMYPKTRVTLFSTRRGHLRTVEDRVNRELVLALTPRHFEAYWFECNASYPVQWTYVGEGVSITYSISRRKAGRIFCVIKTH